jgi:hypothetical protein
VRAKSGLNKSILDQGWFEFRRQLEYKLNWAGGRLAAVPPHHTSLTPPVTMWPQRTARAGPSSGVCSAAMRITPMWSAQ